MKDEVEVKAYGTVRRKVGDEWEVSDSDMIPMEDSEGTMRVKFEGIEEFQGERCAKLSGTVDFTGRRDGFSGRMTGDFMILRSLEHRVDLQNKLKGRMEGSGDLGSQFGAKMSVKMEGPVEYSFSSVISTAE